MTSLRTRAMSRSSVAVDSTSHTGAQEPLVLSAQEEEEVSDVRGEVMEGGVGDGDVRCQRRKRFVLSDARGGRGY